MTTTYEQGSAARSPSGAPVLTLTGVQKRYGGVRALRGVDLELQAGRGARDRRRERRRQVDADQDRLRRGDRRRGHDRRSTGASSPRAAPTSALHAGIATVYQEPHLFGELTVAENLFIGREIRAVTASSTGAPSGSAWSSCSSGIGLSPDLADVRAADLPVAEQQLVSIAKALSQDPSILILDEPSAILTDREIEHHVRRRPGHARRRGRGHLHQPPARRAGPDHRPGHRAARRRGGRQPAHAGVLRARRRRAHGRARAGDRARWTGRRRRPSRRSSVEHLSRTREVRGRLVHRAPRRDRGALRADRLRRR